MAIDDLLKGLGTFTQGVRDLAISSALKESNQAIADLNTQNLDEADKTAAMNQVGQGLASRLMGAGANAAQIESVVGRVARTPDSMAQTAYQDKTLSQNQSQFDDTMKYNYAKLAADKKNLVLEEGDQDDIGKLISSRVPEKYRAKAYEERTKLTEYGQLVADARQGYTSAMELAKNTPMDALIPGSSAEAKLDTWNANILNRMSMAVKGVPSDKEVETQMAPYKITLKDLANPKRIQDKMDATQAMMEAKAPGAGTLESFNIKGDVLKLVKARTEEPKAPVSKWQAVLENPSASPELKAKAQKIIDHGGD